MNVIILGSTGMVGKGVLLECINDKRIDKIFLINRQSTDVKHSKITEIIHSDFYNFSTIQEQLAGYDACYFCLGVSSAGMDEEKYRKITYTLTLHFAETLFKVNKNMCFMYVSGVGTDSNEKSRMAWARIKGKTENDILKLGFKDAYMYRPGYIQPLNGIKSKTRLYAFIYLLFKPFYFILKPFKSAVTDTSSVGKSMITVSIKGYSKKILTNLDINVTAG